MTTLMTRHDVDAAFPDSSWQKILFAEFESALTSRSRPFPCVFGMSGFKADRLRFAWLDPLTPETLAPVLRDYLEIARGIGPMTSFVVFSRPGPVQSMEIYRDRFWGILKGLAALDDAPQPEGIRRELDDPTWEFCFAGEPIFVVCSTPAQVLRQSRRSTAFMITFQPRFVFEGITDSQDAAARAALARVRDLLTAYDAVPPAPYLGSYGDPDNREYLQYFIDDTNDPPGCPFHALGGTPSPSERKGKVA